MGRRKLVLDRYPHVRVGIARADVERELADRVLALDRFEPPPDRLAEEVEISGQPGREVERFVGPQRVDVQPFVVGVGVGVGHG